MSNLRQDAIKARNILATHRGRIKERLIAASRIGITTYDEEKLPSHLKEDYVNLVAVLTQGSKNSFGDGRVAQTISDVTEDNAEMIAKQVMDFITNVLNTPQSEFR